MAIIHNLGSFTMAMLHVPPVSRSAMLIIVFDNVHHPGSRNKRA